MVGRVRTVQSFWVVGVAGVAVGGTLAPFVRGAHAGAQAGMRHVPRAAQGRRISMRGAQAGTQAWVRRVPRPSGGQACGGDVPWGLQRPTGDQGEARALRSAQGVAQGLRRVEVAQGGAQGLRRLEVRRGALFVSESLNARGLQHLPPPVLR